MAEDTDRIIRFKSMGEEYTLNVDKITPRLTQECRQVTGYAPDAVIMTVVSMAQGPTWTLGLDLTLTLIWIARRTAGEPATISKGRFSTSLYDDIAAKLKFMDPELLTDVVDASEAPDPET